MSEVIAFAYTQLISQENPTSSSQSLKQLFLFMVASGTDIIADTLRLPKLAQISGWKKSKKTKYEMRFK
ncbi:hypothetical protein SAMN02745900_01366 [Pseudomonas sp. URIL14HWK12:I8]|nr:hypothetical protein SAMN02745900_01366 [Pseudomonas sp. URIL14HWK12:I8]